MDRDLIERVCSRVFPSGSEIAWNVRGRDTKNEFLIIPGSTPRWLVPADPRLGLPFLTQWSPYTRASHIKWQILMKAYSFGVLNQIPGITSISVKIPDEASWGRLGLAGPGQYVPVILIDRPGYLRKIVVGLACASTGQVCAIAKIPVGPDAAQTIVHESEVLMSLEKEKPGCAPRIIYTDGATGIACQEFIAASLTSRNLTMEHVKYLLKLSIPGETICLREEIELMRHEVAQCANPPEQISSLFDRMVNRIKEPIRMQAVRIHGDFAFWNVRKLPDGEVRAFDWEDSLRKGLPLFDLLYFRSVEAFYNNDKYIITDSVNFLILYYMSALKIPKNITEDLIITCLLMDWLRAFRRNDSRRAAYLMKASQRMLESAL